MWKIWGAWGGGCTDEFQHRYNNLLEENVRVLAAKYNAAYLISEQEYNMTLLRGGTYKVYAIGVPKTVKSPILEG